MQENTSRSIYNAVSSTIATHLIITSILALLLFSRVRQVLPDPRIVPFFFKILQTCQAFRKSPFYSNWSSDEYWTINNFRNRLSWKLLLPSTTKCAWSASKLQAWQNDVYCDRWWICIERKDRRVRRGTTIALFGFLWTRKGTRQSA